MIKPRFLGLIGLLGGLGGAINVELFLAKFPVEVSKTFFRAEEIFYTPSLLALAGFFHGALLAVSSIYFAALYWERPKFMQWLWIPVVGWLTGYVATVPFALFHGGPLALIWPLMWVVGGPAPVLWVPFWLFGLVGVVYYFLLNVCRSLTTKHLGRHVLIACVSGVTGSLWAWLSGFPYITGPDFSLHPETAIR